jgi:putative spermidine/putrescine transport system substrate-binding protein
MDRALRKIAEIKPCVVKWWQTNVQAPQLLLDGEADMCMAYSGRIGTLLRDEPDAPIASTWNQAFTYFDFFAIPKNDPHPDAALALISYRMDPTRAARLAEVGNVPLPSPLVYQAGDPKLRASWPNSPEAEAGAIRWDADYWGAPGPDGRTNEEYAQEKLNELLAK